MPTSDATHNTELVLRDYFNVLRRQKWIILLSVLIVGAAALAYSLLQPNTYRATAEVLINESSADPSLASGQAPTAANEIIIMTSQNMRDSVVRELGYAPRVSMSHEEDAKSIEVSAESRTAQQAAKEADDFASTFVRVRRTAIGKDLDTAIADLNAELAALDREVAGTRARIRELDALLAAETDPAAAGVLTAERERLQYSIDGGQIAGRQSNLRTQVDQLQIRQAYNKSRGYFVVSRALVPRSPVAPKPPQDTAIGLAIGLVLGLCIAFLRDYLDDTLGTKEDLDSASGNIPVLSLIPAIPGWRKRDEVVLESVTHPRSATSEAYRSLRTALEFASIEHKINLIQVTSSVAGEGKTTTAANLAVAMANAGKRVLLVDCDLRRPRAHKFFMLDNEVGFTSVLLGQAEVKDALQRLPGVPNLLVLPSGPPPPNPSEVLSSSMTKNTLALLAKLADHVIIDSPPLLPVADSSVLAGYADATVLVVTARSTTRRSLRRSLELLAQVNAPLEGIVFNGVGLEATYGYGYGYTYDEEPISRASRTRA